MLTLVALHFVAAAAAPALVRILDRRAFYVLAIVPAVAFVWLSLQTGTVTGSGAETITQSVRWIPTLGVEITLTLTTLTWLLGMLVSGIGALILVYCAHYFKTGDTEMWRFSGVMTAFAGTMLGLVLSADLIVLFVFWEGTTILSYLLVGHNPERKANRRAAMNALLVTTFGGLAMLIGIIMLGSLSGTYNIYEILADPPRGTAAGFAVALLLVGALSKSALVPFHFWLPGAMAAPTPVSAYLHAAAMVKAGIFLVALIAPAFAMLPGWRETLIVLGITTMVIGGLRSLRQYDIKLLLAYGTVSQLGFLTLVVGLGTRAAALAGLALLLSHALFKASLFLIVGIVDRRAGTRDLRKLSGMRRATPIILPIATVLAALSMAGVAPLFGFVAKEAAFVAAVDLSADTAMSAAWQWTTVVGLTFGSVLTVAYTARFVWGVFGDKDGVDDIELVAPIQPMFMAAPVILALASLLVGFAGQAVTDTIAPYTGQFEAGTHDPYLALWHGFNLPLVLSLIAILGGLLLFAKRRPVARAQRKVADGITLPDAERSYYAFMRGLDRIAVEVTGTTQRGSLPIYLSVILVVLVALTTIGITASGFTGEWELYASPAQLFITLLIAGAAVATVRSRRRMRAILLTSACGYGVALLFILHGAPDLALTQTLVETVTLVIFVLVLRRLPDYFTDSPLTRARYYRVGLGVATGAVLATAAFVAAAARQAERVSIPFPEMAYDFGSGSNVVNVTLVDIRAWDTFGELSVLVVAATGVASLIFVTQSRAARIRTVAQRGAPRKFAGRTWLRSGGVVDPDQRSVVFEMVTRAIFHPIILFSLYLVFAGHDLPGGGFAGGLVAGLALMVRYLAGGRVELDEAAPVDAGHVLGAGLAIAALSAIAPVFFGMAPFESAVIDIPLGPLGDPYLVTSVIFDVGVYLVVIGLMLDILRSLGGGIDRHAGASGRPAEPVPEVGQ